VREGSGTRIELPGAGAGLRALGCPRPGAVGCGCSSALRRGGEASLQAAALPAPGPCCPGSREPQVCLWQVSITPRSPEPSPPRYFLKNFLLRRKMSRLTLTLALSNIFMTATPSYCSCRRSCGRGDRHHRGSSQGRGAGVSHPQHPGERGPSTELGLHQDDARRGWRGCPRAPSPPQTRWVWGHQAPLQPPRCPGSPRTGSPPGSAAGTAPCRPP